METTDRRIIRTRNLLRDALIALSLEKGFDTITIQDITERADIGYRTFFRHYSDPKELLVDTFEVRMQNWREMLPIPNPADDTGLIPLPDLRVNGERFFEYAAKNHDLFQVIFGDEGCHTVKEIFIKYGNEKTLAQIAVRNQSEIDSEILANYIVSATFSLLRWWLQNDMPHSPARMGEIFAKLIMKSAQRIMETPNKA